MQQALEGTEAKSRKKRGEPKLETNADLTVDFLKRVGAALDDFDFPVNVTKAVDNPLLSDLIETFSEDPAIGGLIDQVSNMSEEELLQAGMNMIQSLSKDPLIGGLIEQISSMSTDELLETGMNLAQSLGAL